MNRPRIRRGQILQDVVSLIQRSQARGVLLIGEPGSGKSALTDDVAEALGDTIRVVRIQGSRAIADVPYGALIPLLGKKIVADAESPTALALALTSTLQELGGGAGSRGLLLIVDDADDLDGASAAFITQLLMSRKAQAMATTRTAYNPGLDLLSEQNDGLLVRKSVPPLSQDEVHRICRKILDGGVSRTVSTLLGTFSGGNPRRLHVNLEQLRRGSYLTKSGSVWLLGGQPEAIKGEETGFVAHKMASLPRDAREILELVALAEPVELKTLKIMDALTEVDLLLENGLLRVGTGEPKQVRPRDPVQAAAIRAQVPAGRSLQLHARFEQLRPSEFSDPESKVRHAVWSLQCGERLDSSELVKAARLAVGGAGSGARFLSSAVTDPEYAAAATVEKAYTHYFARQPVDALSLLEEVAVSAHDPETLTRLLVLRDLLQIHLGAGQVEKVPGPEQVASIARSMQTDHGQRQMVDSCERMAELLALEGRDPTNTETSAGATVEHILEAAEAVSDTEAMLVALTLLGSQLARQGLCETALEKTSMAMELLDAGGPRLAIHMERVLRVHMLAQLLAGRTADIDQMMIRRAGASWRQLARHSTTVDLIHGIVDFQRGAWQASLEQVDAALVGMDSSGRDSTRSVALGLAGLLAALTGRTMDHQEYADTFGSAIHGKTSGSYLLAEGLYLAGLHRAEMAPDAPRKLQELARQANDQMLPALELELHLLAVHCRDASTCERIITLTRGMEGPRVRLVERYARAVSQSDVEALHLAAEEALAAGFALVSLSSIEWAHDLSLRTGNTGQLPEIRRLLSVVKPRKQAGTKDQGAHGLTKREREIVALVMRGHSNAEIAEELFLSIRTVEGHIYRAYDKLGVNSRGQLGRQHLE